MQSITTFAKASDPEILNKYKNGISK